MEKILNPRTVGAAVGLCIGSLLLMSCGEDTESIEDSQTNAGPTVETEYYSSGMRIIYYKDDDGAYSDVLQFCDGPDLLEQTSFNYRSGNAPARSVGHAACADGVLTPEDFEVEARG